MTDQLALGVLWREIARRACNSSYGSPEGVALTRVASAIAEDVERLVERARSQRAELEPFHAQAAQAALR